MLCQLAGENQPNGGLNFARGDCGFFVVGREFGCFAGDSFEDVVDE